MGCSCAGAVARLGSVSRLTHTHPIHATHPSQSLDDALPVPGQTGLRRQRRALFPVVLHLQRPYPGRLISLEHAGLGLADVK